MKSSISLNSYPINYKEEDMPKEEDIPEVIIEIRYRKTTYNKIKANILADEIETFLKGK